MTLKPCLTIDPPFWMQAPALSRLMAVIGQEGNALMVGGCVRNWLLKKPIHDIDIATKFKPDEVIELLEGARIKALPTGVKHGTVTAVLEGQNFEITTLRRDVETDGRHAEVAFTDDWVEDAKRRDFTMNTLLADLGGHIYDPLGQGVRDVKAGTVCFVGEPDERIAEDYLRILRFFRFHAYYGLGEMDQAALQACARASDQIKTLSRERITSEFLKILSVENPASILKIMFDHKVLPDVLERFLKAHSLNAFCALQAQYGEPHLMARLFLISGFKTKFYDDVLRLTHAQKNFLVKLEMAYNPMWYQDERALKKAIYHHGRDLMMQGYLLLIASGHLKEQASLIDILQNWQAPDCPITGEQLIAEGYVTGPDLGQELGRRKEEWLESVV